MAEHVTVELNMFLACVWVETFSNEADFTWSFRSITRHYVKMQTHVLHLLFSNFYNEHHSKRQSQINTYFVALYAGQPVPFQLPSWFAGVGLQATAHSYQQLPFRHPVSMLII
jgi:hypothetical protein